MRTGLLPRLFDVGGSSKLLPFMSWEKGGNNRRGQVSCEHHPPRSTNENWPDLMMMMAGAHPI